MRALSLSLVVFLITLDLSAQVSAATGEGILFSEPEQGSKSAFIYIDSITIEGNKKTLDKIILRELNFAPGDSLAVAELNSILSTREELIMNTGLFTRAEISFKNWEGATNKVHLHITVEEGWYIYPVPVFELADRNFNVWWVEQKRALNRLNFGVEFTHLNLTGRRDNLKVTAKYGYTRQYIVGYKLPYINKKQTLGISVEAAYAQNREINYATVGNKQVFFRDDDQFVLQRFRVAGGLTWRPGLRISHGFYLEYQQNRIAEIVAKELNPDYFLKGRQLQRYLSFSYSFVYDERDVRGYPLRGKAVYATVEKDGIGFFEDRNALTLTAGYDHHWLFRPKWSLGIRTSAKYSPIREQQPYNDNRAIGFGKYSLHGYEYYIIDGLDMALTRWSLRYELFKKEMHFGKIVPIKAMRRMPLRVYLALNNDVAYANDPYRNSALNPLSNRWLWGGGLGLDFVMYYDKVARVEYSFNHLGEGGLFLHLSLNI
ncbi:MAG: BamA/TamA family outer membrane protein [Saprospiraceae bacterium]|nr:BamA/TamA family outer membrane protein [Saprospiraceae bacterium]